jgi:hypothetical protein
MKELFKSCPKISYGKRKNLPAGIVEDYLILPDSGSGFTATEKNEFERICKSFSWTSTSDPSEILPPCFGFFSFKNDSSILLARFIDDGRDNQGRPDLLRVDALKIPNNFFVEIKTDINFIFDSENWLNCFQVENSSAANTGITHEIVEDIFGGKFNFKFLTPLLIGCKKNFQFKPKDGKFDIYDIVSKNLEKNEAIQADSNKAKETSLGALGDNQKKKSNDQKKKRILIPILFVLIAFVSLVCNYFQFNEKKILDKKLFEDIEKQNSYIVSLETVINTLDTIIITINSELGDSKRELADEKNKPRLDVDDLVKKLGANSSYDHAREVLEKYKNQAMQEYTNKIRTDFKKKVDLEFKDFQNNIDDWLNSNSQKTNFKK